MKSKVRLIFSVIQLIFGLVGAASFAVLYFGGENVKPWVPAILCAALLIADGIWGIAGYRSAD